MKMGPQLIYVQTNKPPAKFERRGRHVRPGGLGGPEKRCTCLVSGLNQFQGYDLMQCREWGGSGMTEIISLIGGIVKVTAENQTAECCREGWQHLVFYSTNAPRIMS